MYMSVCINARVNKSIVRLGANSISALVLETTRIVNDSRYFVTSRTVLCFLCGSTR